MWTFLKRFILALLFDEAAAQRYLAVAAYGLGSFLETGGVIPGTETVVPIGHWAPYGGLCKLLAFYLGAGSALPLLRSGNGKANGHSVPAKP